MSDIVNVSIDSYNKGKDDFGLAQVSKDVLAQVQSANTSAITYKVPIAEISTLGATVASLVPAFRTITSTTNFAIDGLYRVANAGVGDVLKVAKNGNYWASLKTAEGASKFVQLADAGSVSATTKAVSAINPAMLMMTVALFSIEKELGNISEMQKKILSFLEIEKESQIEADLKLLSSILNDYKNSWDNEQFVSGNYKLVLDIKRTAFKNITSYQKEAQKLIENNKLFTLQNEVSSKLDELVKKFKYYKLSVYTYSLATLVEAILSQNFKEEYLQGKIAEIRDISLAYRNTYAQASNYIEKQSHISVETNVIDGLGSATNAIGSLINKTPVKDKISVGDFLCDKGEALKQGADKIGLDVVKSFAEVSNPGTNVFSDKLEDMLRIYNQTENIYFDKDNVYVIAG